MKTHPTPQHTPDHRRPQAQAQLLRIERDIRQSLRHALAWGVVACLAFIFGTLLDATLQVMFEFLRWTAAGLTLICLGRWLQASRMEMWLREQAETEQDVGQEWSSGSPGVSAGSLSNNPGHRLSVRSYASLEEAQAMGWRFGAASCHYDGQDVPAWAENEEARFAFDGLASGNLVSGVVPDHLRLFGRLRYARTAAVAEPPAEALLPTP